MASRISNITTPAGLALPGGVYVPATAMGLLRSGAVTERELRAEYTRIRSIVNKRVARAEKAGVDLYSKGGTQITKLPKLSELKSVRDVMYGLAEARGAIKSERGTVGQVKAFFAKNPKYMEKVNKTIKNLNKGGVKVSTETGMNIFTKIMDAVRVIKGEKIIGSPIAAEVAERAEEQLEREGSITQNDITQIFRDVLDDYDIPLDMQGEVLKAFAED